MMNVIDPLNLIDLGYSLIAVLGLGVAVLTVLSKTSFTNNR